MYDKNNKSNLIQCKPVVESCWYAGDLTMKKIYVFLGNKKQLMLIYFSYIVQYSNQTIVVIFNHLSTLNFLVLVHFNCYICFMFSK